MGREKVYYKIGEVSELVGVPPHVLRYWEKEFPQLRPRRIAKRRLYRREEIELIRRIKELLHQRGFTLKGAKAELKKMAESGKKGAEGISLPAANRADGPHELLKQVRGGLEEIYRLLGGES